MGAMASQFTSGDAGELRRHRAHYFAQLLLQAQIKENMKAPRHWPLCGEFTGDRWIPRTKGQ